MSDMKEAILAEAADMAMHHPSKDARAFACSVSDFLANHAGAAAEPVASVQQDYPPLPDKDFIGDDVCWGYDAQSMRDYVDADRKARQLAACNCCLSQAAEARAALTSAPAVPEAKDPVELYEGWAVFNALSDKAKTRTSPENVSDTLDAVVRLIRSRAELKGVQPGERGEG